MNNTTVYVVFRWSEGGDENTSTVLGVYSNLDKADAAAYTKAKEESTSDGVQLRMEINIMGLRSYVFDPSEEDRTYYEVSVRMLDADPSVPVRIQPPLYNNPPPIQQAQFPWSNTSQPISLPAQFHPGMLHQQEPAYQRLNELGQQKLRRFNVRHKIDAALEQYLKTPNHMPQSLSLAVTTDPWERLNRDVLVWSGISFTDTELNYAKAYISERLVPIFTASHPEYVKQKPLQNFGGESVHEQDQKLDEQFLQVQAIMGPRPLQVAYPFVTQQPSNSANQITESFVHETRRECRHLIETRVEMYIRDELRDFEGAQEAMKQINPELNRVSIIEHRMTELFTATVLADMTLAYKAERAYADAYIEERARAFVTILDPDYMWKSYKGQVFVGKVAQMRHEFEKNPNSQGQQNLSLTTQQLMSMIPQTRNN